MGTIEFHAWGGRAGDVEQPDFMIFGLDPDEGLDFEAVKSAARRIQDRLADIGLVSFAMLSGGKGVHVIVPFTPGHALEAHKDFAHRFAEALSLAEPDRILATMNKAKRKGKILIDWLRNRRGATAVLPHSSRARAHSPVAVPITWGELAELTNAHPFGVGDTKVLLRRSRSKALPGWGLPPARKIQQMKMLRMRTRARPGRCRCQAGRRCPMTVAAKPSSKWASPAPAQEDNRVEPTIHRSS